MSNKVTPQNPTTARGKTGKKLTLRQKRLLEELRHSRTLIEAGRRAGYKDSRYLSQIVNKAINHSELRQYVYALGLIGLSTLEDVATKGKNEIARVNAASKLVEQAFGKSSERRPDMENLTIVINKI